jgi:hypothetical protein
VEALARVRSELDVVRIAENHAGEEHQQRTEEARHVCGVAASRESCWSWSVGLDVIARACELKVAFACPLQGDRRGG